MSEIWYPGKDEGVSEYTAVWNDDLWIGSYFAPKHMKVVPDLHVHCARDAEPTPGGRQTFWLKLDDIPTDWRNSPEWTGPILDVVTQISQALQENQVVLVTCMAGINRSAMVVALTLMLHYGLNADQAIRHIRSVRSHACLSNRTFEDFVRNVGNKMK